MESRLGRSATRATRPAILLDTGPLVAFLSEADAAHTWVAARFAELAAPFLSSEAVLTEAFFLLSSQRHGIRALFELLASGLIETPFSAVAESEALARLIHKYRDLPMSLADACMVRLAELNPGAAVFTLDNHFRIYRMHGRQAIPVILP